jgi:sugar lactone lactonase YvrE
MASPLEYLPSEHICSRPLGLCFNKIGDLYIVDAYFGLLKVGPEGGLATPLATEAEVVRVNFTNDPDLDDEGNIYFTDSRIHYQRRSVMPCPRSTLLLFNLIDSTLRLVLRCVMHGTWQYDQ